MPTGIVKFFNIERGFGFITPDEDGRDVFVHISTLEKSGLNHLDEGDKVSFSVEREQNGKEAASDLRIL